MQPRLRTIVWRELPPCVRRNYVWVSRRLFHAELLLGRLYLSWTKSPTWNCVAVAGTLGILLTILLFLAPWADPPQRLQAESISAELRSEKRPWELDSRLAAAQTSTPDDYPVEFAFEERTLLVAKAPVIAEDDPPPRRRHNVKHDSPDPFGDITVGRGSPDPAHSDIAEEPTESEPSVDWFDGEFAEEPATPPDLDVPDLDVEVEFVSNNRRRRHREPELEEISLTARTGSSDQESELEFSEEVAIDDWQPFDASRLVNSDETEDETSLDHQTVGATRDEADQTAWVPEPFPGSAPTAIDIGVEVSIDASRESGSRRRRSHSSPQLHFRNLGSQAVSRIDLVRGKIDDTDFTIAQRFSTQTLPQFSLEEVQAVPWTAGRSAGKPGPEVVSVVVTAFVGHVATVIPAAATESEPSVAVPAPSRRQRIPAPKPVETPQRPHLTLTSGAVQRLPQFRMLSVPLRVVNDGNVPLNDVIIVAEIPAGLTHRFGPTVHYRAGSLRPGEQRQTYLLLTPNEPGRSTVALNVADAARSASADGTVDVRVAAQDLPQAARAGSPRAESPRVESPRAASARQEPPLEESASEESSPPWKSTRRRRPPPP